MNNPSRLAINAILFLGTVMSAFAGGPKDTDRWARFREFRILQQAE